MAGKFRLLRGVSILVRCCVHLIECRVVTEQLRPGTIYTVGSGCPSVLDNLPLRNGWYLN